MAQMKQLNCAWCSAPFFADRRHKYCSEQCAEDAHRAQARERFKRRYQEMHEQECERQHKRYWSNPEKEKARVVKWQKENAERHREYMRKYYHERKKATDNT